MTYFSFLPIYNFLRQYISNGSISNPSFAHPSRPPFTIHFIQSPDFPCCARALIPRVTRPFFLSFPSRIFFPFLLLRSNNALQQSTWFSYCALVASANDREVETGGLSVRGQRLRRGWRGNGIASSGKLSTKRDRERDRERGEGETQKGEGGSGWLLPAVQGWISTHAVVPDVHRC